MLENKEVNNKEINNSEITHEKINSLVTKFSFEHKGKMYNYKFQQPPFFEMIRLLTKASKENESNDENVGSVNLAKKFMLEKTFPLEKETPSITENLLDNEDFEFGVKIFNFFLENFLL